MLLTLTDLYLFKFNEAQMFKITLSIFILFALSCSNSRKSEEKVTPDQPPKTQNTPLPPRAIDLNLNAVQSEWLEEESETLLIKRESGKSGDFIATYKFSAASNSSLKVMKVIKSFSCSSSRPKLSSIIKDSLSNKVFEFDMTDLDRIDFGSRTDGVLEITGSLNGCESLKVKFVTWKGDLKSDPRFARVCFTSGSGEPYIHFVNSIVNNFPVILKGPNSPIIDENHLCGQKVEDFSHSTVNTQSGSDLFISFGVYTTHSGEIYTYDLTYSDDDAIGSLVCSKEESPYTVIGLENCGSYIYDLNSYVFEE